MKNRFYLVGGMLLVAAVGGLLWWSPWQRPGPVSIAVQPAPDLSDVRSSSAIPQSVKAVQNKDTWFGKAYALTWRKLPALLQRRLPLPWQYEGNPGHRARVNAVVATLRQESLGESIDHLIDVKYSNQYLYPGFQTSVAFAQTDLEIMLSTRRSIRVLQDIERLGDREREAMCKRLFSKALEAHTNAFYAVFRHEEDPSFKLEPQPGLSSTLTMGLAMFITADIGRLDILREQFIQLDEFRARIHPVIMASKVAHPGRPAHLMEVLVVPDNRLQANVLRLAASRSGNAKMLERLEAECNLADMRTHEIVIVPWDAHTTSFERLVGSPLDTSKGVRRLRVCDWESDGVVFPNEGQERTIAKLRSVVLGDNAKAGVKPTPP